MTIVMTSIFIILVSFLIAGTVSLEKKNRCTPGNNHKLYPSPEDSLKGCNVYKENSCCTSEFTEDLATSPIHKIGNFSWTQCNNTLSPRCEAFMVHIECFYRCSHNTIFWSNPNYPAAILNAPVCASFCDDWFDACKNDLTCARNWLTDFNMSEYGENTCKTPCRNFSDYFVNGMSLCEDMWGSSFVYRETECLQLNFTLPNPNDDLVAKLFGDDGSSPKPTAFACTVTLKLSILAFNLFATLLLLQN